jgi:hypothetical protein
MNPQGSRESFQKNQAYWEELYDRELTNRTQNTEEIAQLQGELDRNRTSQHALKQSIEKMSETFTAVAGFAGVSGTGTSGGDAGGIGEAILKSAKTSLYNAIDKNREDPFSFRAKQPGAPGYSGSLIAGMDIVGSGANERGIGAFGQIMHNIGQAVGSFAGRLTGAIQGLAIFQQLMDPIGIILQGAMNILQPLITEVLQPIFGVLFIIGQALGVMLKPAIDALIPVIQWLAEAFVWFYNN